MTLKSINSFILKTFKHFRLFLVIFVLFKVSVCAENISFSKISKGNKNFPAVICAGDKIGKEKREEEKEEEKKGKQS